MKRSPLRKKAKTKSQAWYRAKCVIKAKLIARKRDGDKCQYCGAGYPNVAIHGSHILPEGAYPLMSADPDNIIALCAEHHIGGANPRMNRALESWHSHPLKFAKWFEEKWPGRFKELRETNEEKKRHVVNWQKRWEELSTISLD